MEQHIFISHSSKHEDVVKRLREILELEGFVTWVDSLERSGGSILDETIYEKIKTAKSFIILLSIDSLNSEWVQKELEFAHKVAIARKEDGYKVISLVLPGVPPELLKPFFPKEPIHIFLKQGANGPYLDEKLPDIFAALGTVLPGDWSRKTQIKPTKKQLNFKISLAYPKFLSKRYASSFLVQIYLPEVRGKVSRNLENEFSEEKSIELTYDSELTNGSVVTIRLYCPEIEFSDAVTKKMSYKLNLVSFVGKPKDSCYPGLHQAKMSICDEQTGYEYQSTNFSVKVVDFVFDHISRPLLSNVATVFLSIGSLSIFILTLLGQIDTTFGLTSGTTAGALATAVYFRFVSLYRRPIISYES